MSQQCNRCGGTNGFQYREGQPEHPMLNPWYCNHCDSPALRRRYLAGLDERLERIDALLKENR